MQKINMKPAEHPALQMKRSLFTEKTHIYDIFPVNTAEFSSNFSGCIRMSISTAFTGSEQLLIQ